MKILAKIILSVALVVPLAVHADVAAPSPSESQLAEHGSYINKDGVRVHSPAHTKDGKQPWVRRHRAETGATVSASITKARVRTMLVYLAGSIECVHQRRHRVRA